MRSFTPEEAKRLRDDASNDSTIMIRYLEEKFEEQDKQSKIDRIIAIIGAIFATLAVIVPFFI